MLSAEIVNTQPQKIHVTTTGITQTELNLIKATLPPHIVLQDRLSTNTTFLLTYKCLFTPKYFQALKWRIPILKVKFAYDGTKRKLKNFENLLFSTSEVSNCIFKNFVSIQGGVHNDEVERSTQLLLTAETTTEKARFCAQHGIPTLDPNRIFEPDFFTHLALQNRIFATKKSRIFSEKVFFIDENLPKIVFNKLKRQIIENDGTRVSSIDNTVDFVLSDEHIEDCKAVYFYQFVFDCVENGSLLLAEAYKVHKQNRNEILANVVCAVSSDLDDVKKVVCAKLVAMGAKVKSKLDMHCNYLIVKNKGIERKEVKQKIVSLEWIDQCLYALKKVREEKYLVKPAQENVLRSAQKVCFLLKKSCKVFQFTGLPSFFKNKAIRFFENSNLKYFDCEEFMQCTHLIMGKVSTSEKFLSALANGAWILQPQFVDDFDNSEHFNFEKYEWRVVSGMSATETKMIECIRKWRLKVLETGKPAFYDWIVKLKGDASKVESYRRVLEAGGARITDGDDYNKCFVTKGFEYSDWKSTDYIFAYLFKKGD